jgi:hypothetical protein
LLLIFQTSTFPGSAMTIVFPRSFMMSRTLLGGVRIPG